MYCISSILEGFAIVVCQERGGGLRSRRAKGVYYYFIIIYIVFCLYLFKEKLKF
jgi:hypothetical protein